MDGEHLRWNASPEHSAIPPSINPAPPAPLTPREREVLGEVAAGKTAKEIARSLGISINTVKFHVRNTLLKLGARNMTAAVALALTLGCLP